MLLASLLTGCIQTDPPITTLYVIDVQHQVCSIRQITDTKLLTSKWIEDRPLSACDGVVGLSMLEFLKLKAWLKSK
jgi:hypothetical protein